MLSCNFCLIILLVTLSVNGQRSRNVEDVINRGFDDIVTPEPLDIENEPNRVTSTPQVLNNCRCVAYHQCTAANEVSRTPDNRVNRFGQLNIRFDGTSCQDVLDVCCPEHQITPIAVQPTGQSAGQISQKCGIRKVGGIDFTITGDTQHESGFGEFPWTVALLKRVNDQPMFVCGGSLIHPSVILTGAHCISNFSTPDVVYARAGEWDTQTTKERLPHQQRSVSQILVHEEFNPRSLANDVGLLILSEPFQLDEHINVVCLPSQNYYAHSDECFASGWGKNIFGKQGKYSVIMKKVPLPLVDSETCQTALRETRLSKYFRLHNSFICAGGEKDVDTCQGDGGAPLVCPISKSDNQYVQVGSVAWGIGCKDAVPGVYSNVALFRNWIDDHVRNAGFNPSSYTY